MYTSTPISNSWSDLIGQTYVVTPRRLGLGEDILIGGASGPKIRTIDLSQLSAPVTIQWNGDDCGAITDGADCIVFQGISEIILPECMATNRMANIG